MIRDLCTIPAMAEPDRELISSGRIHYYTDNIDDIWYTSSKMENVWGEVIGVQGA